MGPIIAFKMAVKTAAALAIFYIFWAKIATFW